MEVMIQPDVYFDPLSIPLQQVQDQWSQVTSNEESVFLLQQELRETFQYTLPVLLTPYLQGSQNNEYIIKYNQYNNNDNINNK